MKKNTNALLFTIALLAGLCAGRQTEAMKRKFEATDIALTNEKLLYAAEHGNLKDVTEALNEGADIETKNRYQETAINLACRKDCQPGGFEIIKLLTNMGAEIDTPDMWGQTPFYEACYFGCYKIVKFLIEKKAALEKKGGERGDTPLHIACWKGYFPIVKLLVKHGADINARTTLSKKTPLHVACLSNKIDVVKFLVAKRASVKLKDCEGENPLKAACWAGHLSIVAYLVHVTPITDAFKKWIYFRTNFRDRVPCSTISAIQDIVVEHEKFWAPKTDMRARMRILGAQLKNEDVEFSFNNKKVL